MSECEPMSDRDRTTDRRECGGDVAAYALGALDAAEADAFRRHLESCSVCQEELTAFQHVVHELPLAAAPHKAPSAIRRRVMREVNADARARAAHPPDRRAARAGSDGGCHARRSRWASRWWWPPRWSSAS